MSVAFKPLRPLYRYINAFKEEQFQCAHCGQILERVSLVFNGSELSQKMVLGMKERVDEQDWLEIKKSLLALCRFCREIYCAPPVSFFELSEFKNYLHYHTYLARSSIYEYVIRLRRFDNVVTSAGLSFSDEIIDDFDSKFFLLVEEPTRKNLKSALIKYEQYLIWKSDNENQM